VVERISRLRGFTDLDQGMDGSFTPANAFSGLTPQNEFEKPSNLYQAI